MKHALCCCLLVSFCLASAKVFSWDSRRLATPVVVNERVIPYPTFAMYVMPKQSVSVHFKDAIAGGEMRFNGQTHAMGEIKLTAPATPGLYPLLITNIKGKEQATINIFVLTPARQIDKKGYLNGYRIGQYPSKPLKDNPIYLPPKGFVEVTEDNREMLISPNFKLGHFVSKQAQGYPKYVVLRPELLLKLENILATLNREGIKTDSFEIMSGYRTPWYNQSIGNVPYSRHVWGGASDIFIDQNPRDGVMDDLNGDGKVDRADAEWLAAFIDRMSRRGAFEKRIGGLGIYGANSAHGPFVHVDARGDRARW